jgi:alkanesulfonate monooxygenase SsuD/methylene tetrahydromethanopterin reductase-like flavin-dependent oxidoreductase (luciferase family)
MLSALAAATSRVELGTLVICGGFRNPAMLAKMADTIDEISGGRLILGLGAGYHDAEYRAFGYPPDHRYSRFAEAIQIIHTLLRHGSVDFRGEYYQARECVLQPRGPRPGGPPIMIGAKGQKMLGLVSQYADGWNTISRGRSRPDALRPALSMVDAACKGIGRDPSTLERSALVHWSASERQDVIPAWFSSGFGTPWTGAPDEIAEVFRDFARAGISQLQVVVWPHTLAGLEAFFPVLEALDHPR